MKKSREKEMKELKEARKAHIATRAQEREEAPLAADPGDAVEAAGEVAVGHRTKDGSTGMRRRQRGKTKGLGVRAV